MSIHKMSETRKGRIAKQHGVDRDYLELLENNWEQVFQRLVKEFGIPSRTLRHTIYTLTQMPESLKACFVYYWNTGLLLNCDLSVGRINVTLHDVRDMFLALGVIDKVAPIEAIFFAEKLRTAVFSDPPPDWTGHKSLGRQEFWVQQKFKDLAAAAEGNLPFETTSEFIRGYDVALSDAN